MIQINGNRLSQWDVGRLVEVTGEASHVHFANQGDSKAVIIDIEEGKAKIPDYLLQTGKTLLAYAVLNGVTLESYTFAVRKRERPENYVYEEDQRNYIYELIRDAESAIARAGQNADEADRATREADIAADEAREAYYEAKEASNNANAAAESASGAADNATRAANNANDAANSAEEAGRTAYVNAQNAYDAANNANEAAESANDAAYKANTIAAEALSAANLANIAKLDAAKAATNATDAANNANEAADKAAHTAKSLMVVGKTEGEGIALDDAIDQFLVGLRIFGKTTQDGTPTPDAPVALVSVGDGGVTNTTVCGVNLVPGLIEGKTYTRNGMTLTVYADRCVCSGTPTAAYSQVYIAHLTDTLPKGVYRVDGGQNDAGKVYLQVLVKRNGKTTYYIQDKTFQIYGDEDEITVTIQSGSSTEAVTNYVFYPILHVGSTPIAYEPYKSQTLTISTPNGLPGIPVTSGGNYTDANGQQWICDEIDFARGVYVQRIGKVVLNSQNSYVHVSTHGDAVRFDVRNIKAYPSSDMAFCTHLPVGVIGTNNAEVCSIHGVSEYPIIQILSSRLESVDANGLVKYLEVNPMTFYYVLATPTETPMPEEELIAYAALHTYKNHTTVSNDAGAWMDLEYVMDAKKYIDRMIATGGGSIVPATVE